MTQEEKYKEAFEHARQAYGTGAYDDQTLEAIFPELNESEDERIRKELLDCLRNLIIKPHEKKLRFMAWLERLNLTDLNLLKEFNKGMQEAIMWGREGYEVSPDGKVKSLTQDEIDSVLEKQKEQKPWSEEDEKTINDACCWIAEYAGYLMDKNYGKASMLMSLTEKLKSLRPSWKPSENELAKKHLDGYCMGREDTLREMKDFIESHFNTNKAEG